MAGNIPGGQGTGKLESIHSRQFSRFAEAQNILGVERCRQLQAHAGTHFLLGKVHARYDAFRYLEDQSHGAGLTYLWPLKIQDTSGWWRRKPFTVVGAILTGLTMPLVWWMPTGLPEWQMFAWLLIGGLIFYTCFSIWAMPYYSLQLEMSPDFSAPLPLCNQPVSTHARADAGNPGGTGKATGRDLNRRCGECPKSAGSAVRQNQRDSAS